MKPSTESSIPAIPLLLGILAAFTLATGCGSSLYPLHPDAYDAFAYLKEYGTLNDSTAVDRFPSAV